MARKPHSGGPARRGALLVIMPALCACACAGAPAARAEHVVVPPWTGERAESFPASPAPAAAAACPVLVDGTDVQLVTITQGSALVFTTALESPGQVRRRALLFAGVYDTDGSRPPELAAPHPSPAGFPTSAQYSEVVAGARVEIRPLAEWRVPELRAHLRRRVEHMRRTGSC